MDIVQYNRGAWNQQSTEGCRWSTPVEPEVIERALVGDWEVILTPNKPVPKEWLEPVRGSDILCLASSGGQQAPILAAAGGSVTSFDNSEVQLSKDRLVADRHGLKNLVTVQGDMADLSAFADESFDLVFHAVSNVFVEDILPVWRECARVLRPGGRLVAGFVNPAFFLFDHDEAEETGDLVVRYALPYTDLSHMSEKQLEETRTANVALEFGHSLETQIAGQFRAGFVLTDLYEDDWDDESTPLNPYMPSYVATLAIKGRVVPG